MDDASQLLDALNRHMRTEDGTEITAYSSYYTGFIRDDIVNHNQSMADLAVQAFVGRFLMQAGERVVVSLANRHIKRREMYPEVKRTLLEVALLVAMFTLGYVLLRRN